ncbi:MAG TPA: endo-1,4-beta-xylanase [Firmicutes bacterium]|nr:endo-1,4-beta-xylanase [Bacillota bacterium]
MYVKTGKKVRRWLSLLLCILLAASAWMPVAGAETADTEDTGDTAGGGSYYDLVREELEANGFTNYDFIIGGETEEEAYRNFRHNKVTNFGVVDVEDAPFEKALNIEVTQEVPNDYDISTSCDLPVEVKAGENIWLRFYVKSVTGEEVKTCAAIKPLPDYADWLGWNGTRTAEGDGWVRFDFFTKAPKDAVPGTNTRAFLDFVFGYKLQHLLIGGITVVRLQDVTDMQIDALSGRLDYEGREPDAPWRAKAQEMIEENRMGDLLVHVKNPDGTPLTDADIRVEMTRHQYTFGGAISVYSLVPVEEFVTPHEILTDLFNTIVFGNDLKWPAWEGDWGNGFDKACAEDAIEYLLDEGMDVVGHVLFWPSFKHTPAYLQELADDPEAIRVEIENHIREMVSQFKGKISAWDVVNEAYDNNEITCLLDEDGINDPKSLIDWFQIADEEDPDCLLTYNDYGMFGTSNEKHYEYMRFICQYLKENGAPIDLIGAQAYFSLGTIVGPEEVWRRLDDYQAAAGLPVKISEFNLKCDARMDENIQAFQYDFTRDFLTALYAHPNSCGFIGWGNEGQKGTGDYNGLLYGDWTLTPMGQAMYDLVKGEWWTDESGKTDANGDYQIFGTLGDYKVTVTKDGVTKEYAATLDDKDNLVTLELTFDPNQTTEHEIVPEPELPEESQEVSAEESVSEPESSEESAAQTDASAPANSNLAVILGIAAAVVVLLAVGILFWKKAQNKQD